MNVKVGDTVEMIYHMSNRGNVIKVYYTPVKAGSGGNGPFSKLTRVIFESKLDGKTYDVKAQDIRVVRD